VPNTQSKKQIIVEYCKAQGLERVGAREIRAIEAELGRRLGSTDRTSCSYIANILRLAGARVEYEDRYVDPWMDETYERRLKGLLQFRDIETAEVSLRQLDEAYREYRENSDRLGTTLVRSLVLKGKQRAESLAANPRVSPEKRREKQEIAHWFRVWLEISDLFFDWLELRKKSEEFKHLFASPDGRPGTNSQA